jgi:hypothetical protein
MNNINSLTDETKDIINLCILMEHIGISKGENEGKTSEGSALPPEWSRSAPKHRFLKPCQRVVKEESGFVNRCHYETNSGNSCTYAHTLQELVIPKCRADMTCQNWKCPFLHSDEDTKAYFKRMPEKKPNLPETEKDCIWEPSATLREPFHKHNFSFLFQERDICDENDEVLVILSK